MPVLDHLLDDSDVFVLVDAVISVPFFEGKPRIARAIQRAALVVAKGMYWPVSAQSSFAAKGARRKILQPV